MLEGFGWFWVFVISFGWLYLVFGLFSVVVGGYWWLWVVVGWFWLVLAAFERLHVLQLMRNASFKDQ